MRQLLVLSCFFLSLPIFALEVTIVGKNLKKMDIELGDYFQAEIVFSPKKEVQDPGQILKLFEKGAIGPFYIIDHKNLRASENNSEVIVASVNLVQTKPATTENSIVEFDKKKIQVKFQGFIPSLNEVKPEKIIVEQFLSEKNEMYLKIGMAVIALLFLTFLGYFIFIKNRNAPEKARDFFKESKMLFKKVGLSPNRQNFELLFRERDLWISYTEKKAADDLLNIIDGIQYQESWNEEELDLIIEAFKKVRLVKHV